MNKEPVNEASYFLSRSTYNNMIEKLTKALQCMRDAFPAIMIPIYNFISAIADLIIKF